MNPEEVESLPPYSSPKWCDHGPIVRTCSRCDPSEASGKIRAREAREQARRVRHINPLAFVSGALGTSLASNTTILQSQEEQEEKA